MIRCKITNETTECSISGNGKEILEELARIIQTITDADKDVGIKVIMGALEAAGFMGILNDEVGGLPENIDDLIESAMKEARGE